jgi:pimeloyl-ACP methyl ester carboxylesterase
VPLNYEDEAVGLTYVAFIKWTSNSTRANGTAQDILINSDAAGGSGIQAVLHILALFLQSLGTDNNLVGFDPRGVSNSGPNLSCFPHGERGTSRFYHNIDAPIDYSDTKSYAKVFERAAAFGNFCTKAHSAPNGTAKYANTVATVNDIRHYTELLAETKGQDPDLSQLWYYGLSYGTVLGMTFASLFPNRVTNPYLFP